MIKININDLNKAAIKKQRDQFSQISNISSVQVVVKSNNQSIYSKNISWAKLIQCNLSPVITRNIKNNIVFIDLENHIIDTSQQPDQNHYISSLFNNFFFFLTTGYLQTTQQFCADLLYLGILMEINQLIKPIKQLKMRGQISLNKLWNVILYIINEQKTNFYKALIDLMKNNQNFLIDQKNQRQINQNFLKIKSVTHLQTFLLLLYKQLYKVQNIKCLNKKYEHLIQVLAMHYIATHKLDKSQLQKCLKGIFTFYSTSRNQNLIKQNEQLLSQIKQKLEEKSKIIQKQKNVLRNKIDELSRKIQTKKKNIQTLKRYNPLLQIYISSSHRIIHNPSFQSYCQNKQSLKLDCGHYNCIECLIHYCHNKQQKIFSQRDFSNIKINCMHKQGQKNCDIKLNQIQLEIMLQYRNNNEKSTIN